MKRLAILALLLGATPALGQSVSKSRANTAVGSSQIVKVGTVLLSGVNVTSGASAGYVMLFDSATVPADGAVTPLQCVPLAANTGLVLNYRSAPQKFDNGLVVVFSTTGCFTKTASATAFIAGDLQ